MPPRMGMIQLKSKVNCRTGVTFLLLFGIRCSELNHIPSSLEKKFVSIVLAMLVLRR